MKTDRAQGSKAKPYTVLISNYKDKADLHKGASQQGGDNVKLILESFHDLVRWIVKDAKSKGYRKGTFDEDSSYISHNREGNYRVYSYGEASSIGNKLENELLPVCI